ncbi:prolipoprotein diacylglyceryl transferase [Candidatus Dependentiae bacterium]|nr:prolipoprotein diacylglyceryl transferase [Candidatus Dependentiae bacterium]
MYVPLLQSVARVGCFLAGCCYGAPTKQWWGVTFSSLHSLAPLHVPLHPTQLYSSLASLSIFFILYFVSKRIYRIPGTLVLLYLILESCSRFTVDLWRGDGDIAMRGIVSVLFLISLVVLINLVYGKKNKDIKNKKEAR